MFFSTFPLIDYYFDDPTQKTRVTHILRRAAIVRSALENISTYDEYYIREGEFPEQVAFQVYGDSMLHWVVLMYNDIIDPYEQWPKNHDSLVQFVYEKYGAENAYEIHHYEDDLGNWVSFGPTVKSVTNFDYESDLNETKRAIKVPKSGYIKQILNEHAKVLQDV